MNAARAPDYVDAERPPAERSIPGLPRIVYMIPEFPGQTHTWIWRELVWMRRWGADIRIVSTRPPPERDRARHAFAAAAAQTTYLFLFHPQPTAMLQFVADATRELVTHPGCLPAAVRLAWKLPVDGNRFGARVLPLILPAARFVAFCRNQAITHVHCHTCAKGALVAMLAHAMGGPPYSLCINANLGWWGGAMAEKIEGSAFSVSTMRWVAEEIARDYPPAVRSKVRYAPVGVDTDSWRPLARREALSPHALNLLCVGRMHASKGFDIALRAVRLCADQGLDLHLTLLGDGPERASLTALATQLGLDGRSSFHGSVPEDEVRRMMGSADLFLLPSHEEPLGVVVMEAMAMGTPVIVTAAGGVGEIVTSGVDATTVPPGDADALAAAILQLSADPALRQERGKRGRAAILSRFDARIGAGLVFKLIYGRDPPASAAGTEAERNPVSTIG